MMEHIKYNRISYEFMQIYMHIDLVCDKLHQCLNVQMLHFDNMPSRTNQETLFIQKVKFMVQNHISSIIMMHAIKIMLSLFF